MDVVKNDRLYEIDSALKNVDTGSLSSLGETNSNNLSVFGSRISGVLGSTSVSNWDCNVKTGLEDVSGKISTIITNEISASEYVSNGAQPVENLKQACAEYVREYDNYVKVAAEKHSQYEMEGNEYKLTETGHKIQRRDYTDWIKRVNAYVASLPKLEEQALRIEKAVRGYFSAFDLATKSFDSSKYNPSDAELSFSFADYFNSVAAVTDEVLVKTNEEMTIENGEIVTVETFKVERTYADGAVAQGERIETVTYEDSNENEALDETDPFVSEKIHEEGDIVTPDKKEYHYVYNEENDIAGLVHADNTVTDKETEKEVYTMNEDREAAYTDITGAATLETNKVEVTEEETKETRKIEIDVEEDSYIEETVITTKNDDTQCGVVETSDDCTVTVYRDTNGKLRAKEEYVDKNGNTCEYSDSEIPEETKTFTITKPDGTTETMEVNPYNPIDQQKMVNKMEDARSQFFTSGASRSGLQLDSLLTDGETCISDVWTDDEYTFTLK